MTPTSVTFGDHLGADQHVELLLGKAVQQSGQAAALANGVAIDAPDSRVWKQ
jgi:hypothetical protein